MESVSPIEQRIVLAASEPPGAGRSGHSHRPVTNPQSRGTGCVNCARPDQWGASSGLLDGRPYPGSNKHNLTTITPDSSRTPGSAARSQTTEPTLSKDTIHEHHSSIQTSCHADRRRRRAGRAPWRVPRSAAYPDARNSAATRDSGLAEDQTPPTEPLGQLDRCRHEGRKAIWRGHPGAMRVARYGSGTRFPGK